LATNALGPVQTIDNQVSPFLENGHHVANGILAQRRLQGKANPLLIIGSSTGKIIDIDLSYT
jgi:hypothetical protein